MSNVEKNVTEKKDVVVSKDVRGELTYENKVIQKIIGLSLDKVPGLLHVDGGFFSNLTEKMSQLYTRKSKTLSYQKLRK